MKLRADLTESHDHVWRSLAAPGTWLTGAERVAVANELRAARRCQLCADRKAALSPKAVTGVHDTSGAKLPATQIELIHKLVTDPGRITRSWVEERLADGLEDTEYVEIAALVSAVLVVDTFHAALGLPLRAMPDPEPGEPTRKRPRTAVRADTYVPTIPTDGLADDYADLYDTSSFVPNVHRAFSLVPEATRVANHLMASHYFPYEQVPRYSDADHDYAVDKMQMELLASRVSVHNDCYY